MLIFSVWRHIGFSVHWVSLCNQTVFEVLGINILEDDVVVEHVKEWNKGFLSEHYLEYFEAYNYFDTEV